MGSKDTFHFELRLHKVDEEADILFLQTGDVVGPVDDPVEDALLDQQPDHPAQLRPVLEVGVQLILPRDITETWNLKKEVTINTNMNMIQKMPFASPWQTFL